MGCVHLSFKPNSSCEHRASDSALATSATPMNAAACSWNREAREAFRWRGI